MILIGAASTQGTRSRQEDAFSFTENRAAVFDGLGGHGGGDKASAAAAKAFANPEWLGLPDAIRMAQWAVVDVQLRGSILEKDAATTIASVQFFSPASWSAQLGLGQRGKQENHLTVAWSGDSRVYLFRPYKPKGSKLEQLSIDHHKGDGLTACLGSKRSWQAEQRTVKVEPRTSCS